MTAITFDTLSSARRLRDHGVPQEQAEAFANELRVANQIDDTQLATKSDIADLRREMAKTKTDRIKWVLGISFGQTAMILAFLKFHM